MTVYFLYAISSDETTLKKFAYPKSRHNYLYPNASEVVLSYQASYAKFYECTNPLMEMIGSKCIALDTDKMMQ